MLLPARCLPALALGLVAAVHAGEITVQAAASLTNALTDIAPLFEAAHPGARLRLNFGASGALLQQVAKGAPADVLASADQVTMDQAQQRRLLVPGQRRDFVSNTLVVIVPATGRPPAALAELAQASYARIAIGLPASVPAGRYTRSALEAANLWPAIEPKVVGAHSVRQALDYVARAEVDAGFVYATDAALRPGSVKVALAVPTAQPVRYPVALLAGAPNPGEAQRFADFLFTPAAQAVFARYGFGRP